jgi:hypothetical protein
LSNSLQNHKRCSTSSRSTQRKSSLSLNLFKHGISNPSFNVEDNILNTSPNSLHSDPSAQSIVTDYFNSVQISPQYDASDSEKDFFEDDEDDGIADDDEINSFLNDPSSPPSVRLTPFTNQVGGHTSFFRFSKSAVCKPLVRREHQFYVTLEKLHPDLLPFVPQYLGVLNVTYRSQDDELGSMPEVMFEKNKHLLPEWMLNKVNSSDKENYDKGCPDDINSQGLCSSITKVNKQLKEEVLCEVFSPKALRARMKESHIKRRHSMTIIPTPEKSDSNSNKPEMSRSLTDIDYISEASQRSNVSLRIVSDENNSLRNSTPAYDDQGKKNSLAD